MPLDEDNISICDAGPVSQLDTEIKSLSQHFLEKHSITGRKQKNKQEIDCADCFSSHWLFA